MKRRGFLIGGSERKPRSEPFKTAPASPGPAVFTNVLLSTHEDKKVRFYDDLIKGKQVLLNLMYASCEGACPAVTTRLGQVYDHLKERMGKNLFMYSMTVKPEDDDPASMKKFAMMHGAIRPGWLFLTGDPYDIETIRYKPFQNGSHTHRYRHLLTHVVHAHRQRCNQSATSCRPDVQHDHGAEKDLLGRSTKVV